MLLDRELTPLEKGLALAGGVVGTIAIIGLAIHLAGAAPPPPPPEEGPITVVQNGVTTYYWDFETALATVTDGAVLTAENYTFSTNGHLTIPAHNVSITVKDSTIILNSGAGNNGVNMFYCNGKSGISIEFINSMVDCNVLNQFPVNPANPGTEINGIYFVNCTNISIPNFVGTGFGGNRCTGVGVFIRNCSGIDIGYVELHDFGSSGLSFKGVQNAVVDEVIGENYSKGPEHIGAAFDIWNEYGDTSRNIVVRKVTGRDGATACSILSDRGDLSEVFITEVVGEYVNFACLLIASHIENQYCHGVHVDSVIARHISQGEGNSAKGVLLDAWFRDHVYDVTIGSIDVYDSAESGLCIMNSKDVTVEAVKIDTVVADGIYITWSSNCEINGVVLDNVATNGASSGVAVLNSTIITVLVQHMYSYSMYAAVIEAEGSDNNYYHIQYAEGQWTSFVNLGPNSTGICDDCRPRGEPPDDGPPPHQIQVTITPASIPDQQVGAIIRWDAHVTEGDGDPSYQWYYDALPIPGATLPYVEIELATEGQHNVRCVASDTTGSDTSNVVSFYVSSEPPPPPEYGAQITNLSVNQTLYPGLAQITATILNTGNVRTKFAIAFVIGKAEFGWWYGPEWTDPNTGIYHPSLYRDGIPVCPVQGWINPWHENLYICVEINPGETATLVRLIEVPSDPNVTDMNVNVRRPENVQVIYDTEERRNVITPPVEPPPPRVAAEISYFEAHNIPVVSPFGIGASLTATITNTGNVETDYALEYGIGDASKPHWWTAGWYYDNHPQCITSPPADDPRTFTCKKLAPGKSVTLTRILKINEVYCGRPDIRLSDANIRVKLRFNIHKQLAEATLIDVIENPER